MVLAAGLGSRLKPFTVRTPKPLVPLLGVPTIEYSLLQLSQVKVDEVVVNVHAHADQLEKYLSERPGLNIKMSDERACLLGSAGGFRKALDLLESTPGTSESFFSLNADVISEVNLSALEKRHQELRRKHGVVMTLCLAHGKTLHSQEGSYTEILTDESTGLITGFGEKKNRVPFYTGTAVFETEAFRHLKWNEPSEFVPEVLKPWIQKNRVGFFWMEELWMDIGSPELWWKSHFQLLQEYELGKTPSFWNPAIAKGLKQGCFSKKNQAVDYDHSEPLAQNYIQWKGDRLDF